MIIVIDKPELRRRVRYEISATEAESWHRRSGAATQQRREPLLSAPDKPGGTRVGEPCDGGVRCTASHDLFAGAKEVILEHGGEQYRLRRTRKGERILTKLIYRGLAIGRFLPPVSRPVDAGLLWQEWDERSTP